MRKKEEVVSSLKESKKIELSGKRKEIYSIIDKNKNSLEFFLKVKSSISVFVYLLNNTKIKRLYLLPSIHRRIPKKVLEALGKSGVKLIIIENSVGRPKKFNEGRVKEVIKRKGKDKDKIKELKISRRNFYYWKKKLRSI